MFQATAVDDVEATLVRPMLTGYLSTLHYGVSKRHQFHVHNGAVLFVHFWVQCFFDEIATARAEGFVEERHVDLLPQCLPLEGGTGGDRTTFLCDGWTVAPKLWRDVAGLAEEP